MYLNSANLSAAFQRMLSEPESKQTSRSQVQQFVVLNHILFSNIATIATSLLGKDVKTYPPELVHLARKTYRRLAESSKKLGDEDELPALAELSHGDSKFSADDGLMKEQLSFIYGVSKDIEKTASLI